MAQRAVRLARRGRRRGQQRPRAHVGYYLLGAGRPALERAVGYRPAAWRAAGPGHLRAIATPFYAGLIAAGTAAVVAAPSPWPAAGAPIAPGLLGAGAVARRPGSELAIDAWSTTRSPRVLPPPLLPKLDVASRHPRRGAHLRGHPDAADAIATQMRELLEHLEVLYSRATTTRNLHFALLTDFPDARRRGAAGRRRLLRQARSRRSTR